MKTIKYNYQLNVEDYFASEFLNEITYCTGDEMNWLPESEYEANFCWLDSIRKKNSTWELIFRIENEFTKCTYKKYFKLQEEMLLELNQLQPNPAFFLPPRKVPVLVKVTQITEETVTLKTIGIRNDNFLDNKE